MTTSNETIYLIENHLKCAKQIKQIILFSFMKIKVLEGWVTRGVEDMVTERDYYLIEMIHTDYTIFIAKANVGDFMMATD